MSKYSEQQLHEMATEAVMAKQAGDPRYLMLVVTLAERTGLSAKECERRIIQMGRRAA